MTTVATYLVEALVRSGVRRIYGVVGDSLNSIVAAVHHNKRIEWIHVRHEEAGAFAASAEAQLTGSLAVCAGSCGPGNLRSAARLVTTKRRPQGGGYVGRIVGGRRRRECYISRYSVRVLALVAYPSKEQIR
jgi:hypothetical protein